MGKTTRFVFMWSGKRKSQRPRNNTEDIRNEVECMFAKTKNDCAIEFAIRLVKRLTCDFINCRNIAWLCKTIYTKKIRKSTIIKLWRRNLRYLIASFKCASQMIYSKHQDSSQKISRSSDWYVIETHSNFADHNWLGSSWIEYKCQMEKLYLVQKCFKASLNYISIYKGAEFAR